MVSIETAGAISQLTGDENVFYSLGSRKTKLFGDDGLPLPRIKKSTLTQKQIDE